MIFLIYFSFRDTAIVVSVLLAILLPIAHRIAVHDHDYRPAIEQRIDEYSRLPQESTPHHNPPVEEVTYRRVEEETHRRYSWESPRWAPHPVTPRPPLPQGATE